MMKMTCVAAIVVLILGSGGMVYGDERTEAGSGVDIRYPPDRTVMEFGLLAVSLKVPADSADLIVVEVDGEQVRSIIPRKRYECFTVPLEPGINTVGITTVKNNVENERNMLTVFQRSDLIQAYNKPPEGFRKDYFHMGDVTECKECHTLEPGEGDRKHVSIAAFPGSDSVRLEEAAAASTSTCYSCHRRLTDYPFVHGPAAVWSCLSCHDPEAEPVYGVKKPDTKVCFGCHIEQKKEWYERKFYHGPFNVGKCAICHSPHASGNPFNLIKPVWNLCLSCHVGKGSGVHIVKRYFGTYFHPTRGKPDPLREGRELSCASCHDPHSSDSPKLWRLKVGSEFELCRECHAG